MRRYYVFIALLCILSLGLAVAVIWQTGTPAAQKARQLDETRRNDFSMISQEINNFYVRNDKLPTTLDEATRSYHYINTKDPESGEVYTYKTTSHKSYDLCTVFSQDYDIFSEEAYSLADDPYAGERNHKKGYDCISYFVRDEEQNSFKPVLNLNPESKQEGALTN